MKEGQGEGIRWTGKIRTRGIRSRKVKKRRKGEALTADKTEER